MSKTIGIISIKGGVGKTTIAASLACDLSDNYNKKVLLIDANYSAPNLGLHMNIIEPHKSIHEVLANKTKIKEAIHYRFGVDVIPGSYIFEADFNPLKLKDKIKKLKNNYDFIILDSSPTLDSEILSTILASDNLFIVTTADYPTLSCSLKAIKFANQRGREISGIILNKVHNSKYELTLDEIEETTNIPIIAKIPNEEKAIRSILSRIPISIYSRKSGFSREISNISAALTNSKENHSFFSKFWHSLRKEQVNRQVLKDRLYNN